MIMSRQFTGKVINVSHELVTLPDGREAELEVVEHPGGAAAVIIDADDRVCLLRQYRYVAGGWIWELPAGRLEPGEPPLHTAQREALEEAGITANEWQELGPLHTSPGVFREVIHLFLARDITHCATAHEADEVIEVHWIPFGEALARARFGEFTDAKTIVGLIRAETLRDTD